MSLPVFEHTASPRPSLVLTVGSRSATWAAEHQFQNSKSLTFVRLSRFVDLADEK